MNVVSVLHHLVFLNDLREDRDVGEILQTGAIALAEVDDNVFDALAAYELEELEAGRVEEVVSRHGGIDDVEDGGEDVVLSHEAVVEFVLETEAGSEEFEGG